MSTINKLVKTLRETITGDVSTSANTRAAYSTDASNYRVTPQVVVTPRTITEVVETLRVAREHKTPVTSRGAGTSCAGNSIGPGVVIDFSRHLNRIGNIDVETRSVWVEPGVIMSDLQVEAAKHGLRFGPDPSTMNRATLGGMIGNNACGPHAVAYGRTADNVVELDCVDGAGKRFMAGPGDLSPVEGLEQLVTGSLALIRTEFATFFRQVSGYSMEHLTPENGRHLARMLAGSEGTLVTVLGARLRLVPLAKAPALIALGYPSMAEAADDVPALLRFKPLAIEGMDRRLVDVVRRAKGPGAVPDLPDGGGWLLIEVGGEQEQSAEEVMGMARELAAAASTPHQRILPAGPEASALWRIRADGAGLGGRTPAGEPAWPGFEDAAVPPEKLGAYIRDFEAHMEAHGIDGLMFGHFGDGCLHVRLDLPLHTPEGIAAARKFLEQAADLVASHGGSISGEHGDGRARSELLSRMYSPDALALFCGVKALFDPDNNLNPGVLVDPDPLDAHLRRPFAPPAKANPTGFAFMHDDGDFTRAVHRCTGVGKCRADNSAAGGFMCPSYRATLDEKDVTRGRARVLQEAANGTLVKGWQDPAVLEALDLCLACKACTADCPAAVNMAQYRSEILNRRYRNRIRPITHYILGWLPRWSWLVTLFPPLATLVNTTLSWPWLRKLVLWAGGMDTRRKMAPFTTRRFSRTHRKKRAWAGDLTGHGLLSNNPSGHRYIMLWADSFSENLDTRGAHAAVELLTNAGYTVLTPPKTACCGLTWITTGQLGAAREKLANLLDTLAPFAAAAIPIIGIEPSCTAVLREDLLELLPEDPRSRMVSEATLTLAELLTAPQPLGPGERWRLPDLSGRTVVAQPHCHHYAVMGWEADAKLLREAGANIVELTGCCGLAGNYGMEAGHYDISVKIAQASLLPALGEHPDATYLADGFSCRTQAAQLADRDGVHLAQLLLEGH